MAYFRCTTSGSGTGATITVSYESEVYGQTLTCTDGTHTYTKTAASTGSTVFTVPNGGTWTISVVMYGHTYSQQVIVVSEYTCTLALWSATVNISTTATELYSQTITVKKGGSTIGSTAFDSSGSATYIAPEEGTYTFECTYSGQTYSASVNVTEETTYSVVISMGLELSNWLTAGGLDPSDYADLSEVLADEEAIRRLMTIHDSVDYLATASAGDQMVSTIISDNTGAKWINLRDYAFDVLSANSDIKSMMDTADKYGYGEWVVTDNTTTPPTWGAKGNVPIMTSNTAPYGTASKSNMSSQYDAWKAFDNDLTTYWHSTGSTPNWLAYNFVNPVEVKKARIYIQDSTALSNISSLILQGSNDGTTWTDLTEDIYSSLSVGWNDVPVTKNSGFFLQYRAYFGTSAGVQINVLQFYGREMKVSVPAMTNNTQPWGEASASSTLGAGYEAWRAFDKSSSTFWNCFNAPDGYIEYDFEKPVLINLIEILPYTDQRGLRIKDFTIQASNDGTNFEDIYSDTMNASISGYQRFSFDNDDSYSIWRLVIHNLYGGDYAALYEINFYGFDYSERDWDTEHPMKYLYDHGVELETITTTGAKEPQDIKLSSASTDATATLDTTDYDLLRGVVGKYASGTNVLKAGSGSATFTAANMPYNQSLDVSNINGSNAVGVGQTANGIFTAEEWWLE